MTFSVDIHRSVTHISSYIYGLHPLAFTMNYTCICNESIVVVLQAAEGVYSAREFVGWYNGLPEFSKVRISVISYTSV